METTFGELETNEWYAQVVHDGTALVIFRKVSPFASKLVVSFDPPTLQRTEKLVALATPVIRVLHG